MNQGIEQVWRFARRFGLMALAAFSLAACATPKYEVGRTVASSTGSAPRPGSMIGRDGKPLRLRAWLAQADAALGSGWGLDEAAVEAARTRLRPILMTSFAFILGVVPLAVAKGAGAEMRSTLGIAVFAGMLGVTIFGIFLTPVFYFVLEKLSRATPAPPVSKPSH